MGGEKHAYKILVGKSERKKTLGRPNIRLDLGEIGWEGMDWMHLAQDSDQWRALFIQH
jgi:hypothetical protein